MKLNLGQNLIQTCLLTVLLALPAAVQAQFTYMVSNGTITIADYTGPASSIIIPATINGLPVTGIASYAFSLAAYDDLDLAQISIPSSVTNIGADAFFNCFKLTTIMVAAQNPTYSSLNGVLFDKSQTTLIRCPRAFTGAYAIPESVTNVGDDAFRFCLNLTNIFVGSLVSRFGDSAFDGCTSLTTIDVAADNLFFTGVNGVLFDKDLGTLIQYPGGLSGNYDIPAGVTNINGYAFADCEALTGVRIPTSVIRIGPGAFAGTGLTNAAIPDSVTNMGNGAFLSCNSLTRVTIGNGLDCIEDASFKWCNELSNLPMGNRVKWIGEEAFSGSGLTNLTIPNSIAQIGATAFSDCTALTNVMIGDGVTNIGDEAFIECSSLTAINVSLWNSFYSSLNGVVFDKNGGTLVSFPAGRSGAYTIPENVTNIGSFAFEYCESLTNITIPEGVVNIGTNAFAFCLNLAAVAFTGNAPSMVPYAFVYDSATVYYSSGTAGWISNFAGLPMSLWDPQVQCGYTNANSFITITTYLGAGGAVIIPATIDGLPVSGIGAGAFSDVPVESVTIPNTVASIGGSAFQSCLSINVSPANSHFTSLAGVLFDKNQSTLLQYPGRLSGNYAIPEGVISIGTNAFAHCGDLTGIAIPMSVTTIGNWAFFGTGLTSLTIPDGVTNLGNYSFASCPNLTSVVIGNSVVDLGDFAFAYDGLVKVTFGHKVTSIGKHAFGYCFALGSAFFTGNAPESDWTTFLTISDGNSDPPWKADPVTLYYLPGTTGWGVMFDGRPTAQWFLPNPMILNNSASFGVQPNGFGFTISWATNVSVVVEAATNLASPVWIPVSTNTLTGGTNYFSDPQWTNYPARFYRIISP